MRIRAKFLVVFALLVPVIFAVPVAALFALNDLRDDAEDLYAHDLRTALVTQHLARGVDEGFELALRAAAAGSTPTTRAKLDSELETRVLPRVSADIAALRRIHGRGAKAAKVERVARGWRQFAGLSDYAPAARVARVLTPVTSLVGELSATQAAEAEATAARAEATARSGRVKVVALSVVAVLLCLLALLWLIRQIVPRTREYSRFAAKVASGSATEPIEPRGADELTSLGETLNAMVARRAQELGFAKTQSEFVDAMQQTESEEEAHGLLKRHLERSIPRSEAVVLNRNNSHDRLEPTTPIDFDSPLEHALRDAHPRSCLAVRFGRMHEEGTEREQLLECELCGRRASERATCEPLLVSGEVIGSVLVQHANPLNEDHYERIKGSVVQAAPVLANLRNLAIAELRARTDALTGLPNNRALQGHLKRTVAYGLRADHCVGVALLDLDHFKQINDTWGHGKGDEVLAAVGAVLQTTLRESDIAGRWGGEEFLILLPNANRDDALATAEKVRNAISAVKVAGVERAITASLGVAVLPDDGTDIATLMRNADRALYTAKARGRNRVEPVSADSGEGLPFDAPPSPSLGAERVEA